MAGEISAIVQITAASWKVVDKTTIFVRDMCNVDKSVERLVQTLLWLKGAIVLVVQTCDRTGGDASSGALVYIRAILAACDRSVAKASDLVLKLAEKSSDSLFNKFALKVRWDWMKPDIDASIKEIELLINNLKVGMDCYQFGIAYAERRIVEDLDKSTPPIAREQLQRIMQEENIDSISSHTGSGKSTIWDPKTVSLTVASSERDSTDVESGKISEGSLDEVKARFHYRVAKCMGDTSEVTKLWASLSRQQDGSVLARSVDEHGRTPLHLAAENDDVDLGRVLVCFSADVNAEDCEPASVLDFAVANNCEDFVRLLLEAEADESKVSEKNQARFKELKQVIEVRKTHLRRNPGKPTRSQSMTMPRGLSIRARMRTGSVVV